MAASRHLWHSYSWDPKGTWKCQNIAKNDLKLYMQVGLNLIPSPDSSQKIALAPAEGKANFSRSLLPQPCSPLVIKPSQEMQSRLYALVRLGLKQTFYHIPRFL